MKVYLAGQFCRRDELHEYAKYLHKRGYEIVSSWLSAEQSDDDSREFAEYQRVDRIDIKDCDLFLHFTGCFGTKEQNERGGRHTEHGLAMAWGKKICIIGPREDNIFQWDRYIPQYNTFEEFLEDWN